VALPSHDRPETEALALTRLVRWWGRRYGRPVCSLRGTADGKSSNRRSASLQTRLETLTLSRHPPAPTITELRIVDFCSRLLLRT